MRRYTHAAADFRCHCCRCRLFSYACYAAILMPPSLSLSPLTPFRHVDDADVVHTMLRYYHVAAIDASSATPLRFRADACRRRALFSLRAICHYAAMMLLLLRHATPCLRFRMLRRRCVLCQRGFSTASRVRVIPAYHADFADYHYRWRAATLTDENHIEEYINNILSRLISQICHAPPRCAITPFCYWPADASVLLPFTAYMSRLFDAAAMAMLP